MTTPENVTVTVRQVSAPDVDLELPSSLPLGELYGVITEALTQLTPKAALHSKRLRLSYDKQLLGDTDTLAGRGVWDGSILTVTEG